MESLNYIIQYSVVQYRASFPPVWLMLPLNVLGHNLLLFARSGRSSELANDSWVTWVTVALIPARGRIIGTVQYNWPVMNFRVQIHVLSYRLLGVCGR